MMFAKKMSFGCMIFCILCAIALQANAQNARINLNYLNRLGPNSVEAVDIVLDREILQVLSASLAADGSDQEKLKKSLAKLEGVYIKGFRFPSPGKYRAADVEQIRSEVRGGGWERVVDIRSKRAGDNAELYLKLQGDRIAGLTIISADPQELFVVNLIGEVDIERISFEEGVRGLSRVNADLDNWLPKRSKKWRR